MYSKNNNYLQNEINIRRKDKKIEKKKKQTFK
jgi:hypothetical protein